MSIIHHPILAFLQNAYIRPEHRVGDHVHRYATDHVYRRRCLALSMTGRRLARAWGDRFSKDVWWDNSTPIAGDHRRSMLGADSEHMRAVFEKVRPRVVVLYGTQAQSGWGRLGLAQKTESLTLAGFGLVFERVTPQDVAVLRAPHPAAFDVSTKIAMRHLVIHACALADLDPPPTHEMEDTAGELIAE